jgi:hypothetical protein
MTILGRAKRIEIAAALPRQSALDRLRRLAGNWRSSPLAPMAVAAGVSGWILEERPDGIVLAPRPNGGGIPLAIFVGEVADSPAGSIIRGVIRLHRAALIALIVVIGMAALMPIGALFESVPRADWHHHLLKARTLACYSVVFEAGALVMAGFGARILARQIHAFIGAAVAQPVPSGQHRSDGTT